MSDISTTSYCSDNKNDCGMNPMMILVLLLLCGGDSGGFLGGCNGNSSCGSNNGLDGMLPILLLLMCGGSF